MRRRGINKITQAFDFSTNMSLYIQGKTDLIDKSVNALSVTNNGVTLDLADGLLPSARFDGNSDYLIVADNDLLSFTDGVTDVPFTIGFRLNIMNLNFSDRPSPPELQFIISKNGGSPRREYQIAYDRDLRKYQVALFNPNTPTELMRVESNALPNPYTLDPLNPLIIFVDYDGSKNASGLRIFLNNVNQSNNSTTGGYTGQVNGTSDLYIGTASFLAGSFDFNAYATDMFIVKGERWSDAKRTAAYEKLLSNESLI